MALQTRIWRRIEKGTAGMNVKEYLSQIAAENGIAPDGLQLPDCALNPEKIKAVMINEAPPQNAGDWFYSKAEDADYLKSALGLFNNAGVKAESMGDILELGIYVTAAVKTPKSGYLVETGVLKAHLPILEAEISLFPNLEVIMLMGDVAKKAVNIIAKARTKRNVIPAESTYKIRNNAYYWGGIRVIPSYIMTGGNILIEKFKREVVSEDIRRMMEYSG